MGRHTRQEVLLPEFQLEIEVFDRHNGQSHALPQTYLKGMKQADIPIAPKSRTIVERFKNHEAALRFGARIGRVMSCKKVDIYCYTNNIEHLNLKQEPVMPIEIEIDKEEFILGKDFEISREEFKKGEFEKGY